MACLKSRWVIFIVLINSAIILWHFYVPNHNVTQQLFHQANNEASIKVHSEPIQMISKATDKPIIRESIKPIPTAINHTPEMNYQWGEAEVVREHYLDESTLDDVSEQEWDPEAYLEQKRLAFESMTDDELDAKQAIELFEEQLSTEFDYLNEDDPIREQLVDYFIPVIEEQGSNTIDLSCSQSVCRVIIEVSDELAQNQAVDAINSQIEGVQKTLVDVKIQSNESRLVAFYLDRRVASNE